MAKEIEIKLKLSEEDYTNLEKQLENKGEFISDQTQVDTYFEPIDRSYIEKDGYIWEWFRLRQVDHQNIVTYKKVSKGENNLGRQKDEYEFEVSKANEFIQLTKALGFKILVEFEKRRKTYNFESAEVTLDSIDELGKFCEIELKYSDEMDGNTAEKLLEELVSKLELNIEQETALGYPHLMLIHQGKTFLPKGLKH